MNIQKRRLQLGSVPLVAGVLIAGITIWLGQAEQQPATAAVDVSHITSPKVEVTADASTKQAAAASKAKADAAAKAAAAAKTALPATVNGTAAGSSPGSAAVAPAGVSLQGKPLYVDPNNSASGYAATNTGSAGADVAAKLGRQPVATWFGGWNTSITAEVSSYVTRAAQTGAMPVLVAYNIPNRDCGGYSAGGAQTEAAYASWIAAFANGIGSKPAVVILEPDALTLQDCLNAEQKAARNRMLSSAVSTLAKGGQTYVYLDAGHSGWLSASETANRLTAAGVASASGFALNVSNFGTTASNTSFGTQVAALVGGKHFVIDTSRNGNGPAADGEWCNPAGRALGAAPTTSTGNALVDAYLWVKTPWQSDGACAGHPAAGQNDWPYATALAQAAGW